MIITKQRYHTAMFIRACQIRVPKYITCSVHTGAFAIPDRKHAIMGLFLMQANLLGSPYSCCRHIFIQGRVKGNICLSKRR